MKTPSTLRALLLGASFLVAPCVQAATYYWDTDGATAGSGGATPSGTWSTGGTTWTTDSTGTTATSALTTTSLDDLFFSAGTDATGAYAISLNSTTQNARLVTFEDGTATLTAATGTLSLGTGGGITVTTNTVTGSIISTNLTLSGAQTFNVAAGRTLTLDSGTFTRNAGSTLNILSTGTVTTTMTGLDSASLVNGIIGPWASFGSGASTRYATIDGSNNIVGLTGTAAATAANVTSVAGNFNYDVAAVGTLGAGANINTLRYTGAAGTIAGALTTNGIMNASGNALTYSGAITSGTGEMVIHSANGAITFSGGLNNNGNLLTVAGPSNVAFTAGTLSGAGGITMNGSGILDMRAATVTYSGPTTINSGYLLYGGGNNIGTGTANITINNGVLGIYFNANFTRALGSGANQIQILGGTSGFSEQGATGGTFNIGTTAQWGSANFNPSVFVLQGGAGQSNLNGQLTFSSGIDLNGGSRTISVSGIDLTGTSNISGVISNSTGTGSLIKIGSGPLTLSNTNTYNGSTTITAGTLIANTTASLGNSSATNTLIFNGGTLRATGTITSVATRGVTMTATGIIDTNGNAISIAGNITGAGGLTKNGAGTLTLSGTNSYGGTTSVTAGTLSLTGSLAGSNVSTSGTGIVTQSATGAISGSGVTFTQGSSGTTILGGTNTYTGLTSVTNGTLIMTAPSSLGNGGLTVASGRTFNYAPTTAGALDFGSGVLTLSGTNTIIGTALGGTLSQSAITSSGAAALSGTGTVNIRLIPGAAPAVGTHNLITAGSGLTGGTYTLGAVYGNTDFTLSNFTRGATAISVDVTSATALSGDVFWKGGLTGNTGVWSASNGTTQSNWQVTDGVDQPLTPGATTDLVFSTATTPGTMVGMTLGANMTVRTITINNTATAFGLAADGNTLTITPSSSSTGITIGTGVLASSIAAPVVLGASQTWTNNSANALTVSGVVSGTAALTKAGTGTIVLSGANTYNGGTNLNAGILNVGSAGAIGTSGTISFGGGTLQYSAANTTDYSNRFSTAASQQYNVNTNSQTVTWATNLTSSGGTLTKGGAGTLTLSGTASTYTGGTFINAGTLVYTNDGNLGASGSRNITFGGTATLTGFNGSSLNTLTLSPGSVGTLNGAGGHTFATTTGSGTLNYNPTATNSAVTNLGNASAFTGNVVALMGAGTNTRPIIEFSSIGDAVGSTLQFGGNSLDGGQDTTMRYNGAAPLVFNNRQIRLLAPSGGNNTAAFANVLNNSASAANTWVINTDFIMSTTQSRSLSLGGSNTGANAFNGNITNGSGTVAVRKTDAGTWTLAGSNTYTGGTTITAGTLRVGSATALGASSGGVSVTSGAVLDLNGITMTNTNALTLNGTNALANSSNTAGTYAGLVTLGITGVSLQANNGNIILSNTGTIVGTSTGFGLVLGGTATGSSIAGAFNGGVTGTPGAGTLTKQGTGTWTLTGSSTYTGATTISTGTLALGTGGNLLGSATVGTAVSVTGTLAVAQNASGNINAIGQVGQTTAGSVTLNAGAALNMGDGFTSTLNVVGAGTLSSGAGAATTLTFNTGASTTDLLAISGVGTNSNSTNRTLINIVPIANPTSSASTYTIITAGSGLTSANFTIGNTNVVTSGAVYRFVLDGSSSATQAVLSLALGAATPASAYWTGSEGNGSWTSQNGTTFTTNFSVNAAATSDTFATSSLFNSTTTVFMTANSATNLATTLDGATSILGLTFTGTGTSNTAGSSIAAGTGGTLTLSTGGITVQSGSGTNTISAPVTLGAAQSWTNNSGNLLTVSGGITGGANLLTIAGTGATTISGATAFTTSTGVTVSASTGAVTISAPMTLGGATALTNNSSNLLTVSGDIDNGANLLSVAGSGNTTISGVIGSGGTVTGGLTVNASGATVTLSGANAYTGNTTLTAGTLIANNATTPLGGASALNLNGGTLDLRANGTAYNTTVGGTATIASNTPTTSAGITHALGTLSIGANTLNITTGSNATGTSAGVTFGNVTQTGNSIFNVAANTTLTLGALQTNTFTITKQNSGTLIMNTAANAARVAGSTTLTAGTLSLGSVSALGTTGTTLSLNGGTLDLAIDSSVNAYNTTVGGTTTIASNTANAIPGITHTLGTLSIGAFTLNTTMGSNATGAAAVTFGATTISGTSSNATFSPAANSTLTLGTVTGTTPLITKSGAGALVLNSTFSTVTSLTINDGSVTLNTNNSTTSAALTIGSTGILNFNNGQIFGVLNGSGTINENGNWLYTNSASNGSYSGTINGTGGYIKQLTGTQTLSGLSSYNGSGIGGAIATQIQNGALSINTIGNVGGGNSALGAPTTAAAGRISMGNAATTGTLIYTGAVTNTDRQIQIGTNSGAPVVGDVGGAIIQNDGTGTLTFSATNFNSATNAASGTSPTRTLTLQGTNGGTISGIIVNNQIAGSPTAAVALTKAGAGTWILSGANSYTGRTTVNGGTLNLGFGTVVTNIISSSSALTLGGGNLELSGVATSAQTFNGLTTTASTGSRILLAADKTLTLGALTAAGAASGLNFNTAAGGADAGTTTVGTSIVTLTGGTLLSSWTVTDSTGFGLAARNGSNQIIRQTTNTLLVASGAVIGTDYFVDNNAGGGAAPGSSSLAVTASESAKSITVDTTAANGVLTLNSAVVLSNSIWNFGGIGSNTYQITGSASAAGVRTGLTAETFTINNYNTGAVTFTSPILAFGTNALVVNGTGTTILDGLNTYTGATTISGGGTLQIGANGRLVAGTYSGAITIGGGSTFRYSGSNAQILSGAITGAGGITKDTNTSDLTLSNTGNTYSGNTTVSSGRISVAAPTNLSSGATSIVQSGTGQLFISAAVTISNPFNISDTGYNEGDTRSNVDGAIRMSGSTLSGQITLSGNSRIGSYGTSTNTISGQITGGYGIDFYGMQNANSSAIVFVLSNTNNNYTGNTTILNGTYNSATNFTGVSTTLRLGASNVIPDGASAGNVVFAIPHTNDNATNILDLNGFNETINGLTVNAGTFATRITNTAAAANSILSIGANNTTSSFSGTITDSGASRTLALIKTGTGILTLSGDNSYIGATTVSAGTLAVTGTGDINSTSSVSITGGTFKYDSSTGINRNVTINGGTFRHNSSVAYSGALTFTSGTIGGTNLTGSLNNLTIGTNQTLSPGNSPGTASTGSQTWATGGTYEWEINNVSGTAGLDPGWDLINGSAALTITAASGGNEFTIDVMSLTLANAAGALTGFSDSTNYNWMIADFLSISGFDTSDFIVDTTAFAAHNTFTGNFGVALGDSPGIGGDNTQIWLTYTAIPEPHTALLGCLGVLLLLRRRR